MHIRLTAGFFIMCIALGATWPNFVSATMPPPSLEQGSIPTLAPMLKKVLPAVVNISTTSVVQVQRNPLFNDPFFRRFFNIPNTPQEEEQQSLGSGVIVNAEKGYIVTNAHVVDNADQIAVTLRDGRNFKAKLIGKDPEVDLAVVQINAKDLTALPISNSSNLQVGDYVVAIGNPFGLGQTVTSGIVSALGRSGLGIEGYEDFIQTDASINPGNSGGALVNLRGEMVGINTAIVGPSGGNVGIGFAIPSNIVKDDMEQIIRYGNVKRGQLGILIQDLTPKLAQAFGLTIDHGVVVSQVVKDSPAEKAGIKPGDVITEANGQTIRNANQLRTLVGLLRIGTEVKLNIIRDGKQQTINIVTAAPKEAKVDAGKFDSRLEGAMLGSISPTSPVQGIVSGIEVLQVKQGSAAWEAGLRQGDIIVSVNKQQVQTFDDFSHAIKESKKGILLNIRRGDSAMFIYIQ